MDELLSISEAADRCGVHIDTLRKWEHKEYLRPEYTHGGHRRYRLSDIEKLQNTFRKARMNYAKQAAELRDERLQKEVLENQAKSEQDKVMAEKQKQQQEKEVANNKELLSLFKQFDKHTISNGEETIEAGLHPTVDGLQVVCLKLKSSNTSRMKSWRELGAVLLSSRYFGADDIYVLRKYDRLEQNNWHEIGKYKTVDDLMKALVIEVAKL